MMDLLLERHICNKVTTHNRFKYQHSQTKSNLRKSPRTGTTNEYGTSGETVPTVAATVFPLTRVVPPFNLSASKARWNASLLLPLMALNASTEFISAVIEARSSSNDVDDDSIV